MRWVVDLLIDFVFPKFCVVCGQMDTFLCEKCKDSISISEQICPMCGDESLMGWTHDMCKKKQGMDGLITIFDYQDEGIKKIIHAIKFGFNKELVGKILGGMKYETGIKFDSLVPVPLHFYRENWRGFNQAEEMANQISVEIGVPVTKILTRIRRTKQQSFMKTKKERFINIKNAFQIKYLAGGDLNNKQILLIDDIFTSGADMRECARILKKAGAKTVWGLALAH